MSSPTSLVVVLFAASGCLFVDPGPAAVESETAAGPMSTGFTGVTEATGGTVTGPLGSTGSTGAETPTTGVPERVCGWMPLAPVERPPGRIDATLTLDEETGRLVLYGGRRGPLGADLQDTWEFDGATWKLIVAEEVGPGPRRGHAAAWDHEHKELVLFGGARGVAEYAEKTWVRGGSKWSEHDSKGLTARAYAAMADMPARKRVVLFGGHTPLGLSDETWEWDGKEWRAAEPMVAPSPRYHHAMALDEGSGQVLLHGGCESVVCAAPLNDTWAYDGKSWKLLTTGDPPGPRAGGAAYDRSEPALLRFGEGEGYRWEGGAWTSVGASPQTLWGFALAYHPGSAGVVLFGGVTAQQVETDGTWVFRCTP